jgi:hypothetical protein
LFDKLKTRPLLRIQLQAQKVVPSTADLVGKVGSAFKIPTWFGLNGKIIFFISLRLAMASGMNSYFLKNA